MSTTVVALESAYQTLSLDIICESTTNPRRTFDESNLAELADSLRSQGLIMPIVVRPVGDVYEIIAGARRFRAARLAGLADISARIVHLDDAEALSWQLVENSQRRDVHPYEEAHAYHRLLTLPGYDVTAIAEKTGKSDTHIYARLKLLDLTEEIATVFQEDRITTAHAVLLARLPQDRQPDAFAQCWRKDWQDKDGHLLPAKHLSAWIESNLYLDLSTAPFDVADAALFPEAGACADCPKHSGYNTRLFADVVEDMCLDAACWKQKANRTLNNALAAKPQLVQIETTWNSSKERRDGALRVGSYTLLTVTKKQKGPHCDHEKEALIVYGDGVGTTKRICDDSTCPVHHPTAEPDPEEEKRERAYKRSQQQRATKQKERVALLERIVAKAPATLSSSQWRIFLRAIITMDVYQFADDVAAHYVDEQASDDHRTAGVVLLDVLERLEEKDLSAFAARLALTTHVGIPQENEADMLKEAAQAFAVSTALPSTKKAKKAPTKKAPPAKKKRK